MADVVLIELDASYKKFIASTNTAVSELNELNTAAKKAGTETTKAFDKAGESVLKFNNRVDAASKNTTNTFQRTSNSVRGFEGAINKAGGVANTRIELLNKSVSTSGSLFNSFEKKGTSAFNAVGGSIASMAAGIGIATALTALVHVAKDSITAASDLNEEISKSGELFGESTASVVGWSKTTDLALGQSQKQALQGAANFAIFGRAAGLSGGKLVDFSTDFVALASDLASFNNTTPEEAITAIGAALRGESEPIRKYGILLDDATLRQEAFTLGIIKNVKTALTPQQRVLAAQAAIYKQTTAAQGDFARTSDGLANQQRILTAQWENMKVVIGTDLLPTVLDLVSGFNNLLQGNYSNSFDSLFPVFEKLIGIINYAPTPINGFIRGIQELQSAFSSFKSGDILGGIGDGYEAIANVISFGLYGAIKDLIVGTDELTDSTTGYEKALLTIVNATDAEIEAKRKTLELTGQNTTAFDKYVKDVKAAAIHQTFIELAKALEITTKQYDDLVKISDAYGISSRINSSLILDIKQSTEQDLNNAFIKFNKTLGVSKKDWDDYIGKVKDIPPLQNGVHKSTTKLIGPYDQLSAAVTKTFKSLQDMSALVLKGAALSKLGDQTDNVKEAQFRLALANNLVTISLGDYKKELEDLKQFMDANGNFIFDIPGGDTREIEIREMIDQFQEIQNKEKELAEMDRELAERDKEKLAIKEDIRLREKSLLDERLANEQFAQSYLEELGIRGVKSYATRFQELQDLRKADLLGNEEYMKALTVLTSQQFADTSSALGDLAGNLSTTLAAIFGDAAMKNAEFASFIQALTITEILFKQGAAIANSIEKITGAQDPFSVIAGIAGLVAAIGGVFSGIIGTIQNKQIPAPPSFAKGTEFVKLNGHPKGIDTIPAFLNEGEGIATAEANKKNPGVIKAMNEGNFDSFIIDKFVTPALQKQEREMAAIFADNVAASLLMQSGSAFNDYKMRMLLQEGNNINRIGLSEIANKLGQRTKRRGGYA